MESAGIITNAGELVNAAVSICRGLGYFLWWRGHGDSRWCLQPGVFRDGRNHLFETNAASRFAQGAVAVHEKCPSINDGPAWLFLMQHHGLPTRLLDWTESALVAAFFAVGAEHDGVPGTLWALDPHLLNKASCSDHGIKNPYTGIGLSLINQVWKGGPPRDVAAAISTYRLDARMHAQLSTFTVHGSSAPLEGALASDSYLRRFEIPAAAKSSLREELYALGMRPSTLFPDLVHLAADIKTRTFVETPPPR
jgi:FRG domain